MLAGFVVLIALQDPPGPPPSPSRSAAVPPPEIDVPSRGPSASVAPTESTPVTPPTPPAPKTTPPPEIDPDPDPDPPARVEDTEDTEEPEVPRVERSTVRVHDHHWSVDFRWHPVWGPLALLGLTLAAVVVALRRSRLPRSGRWFAASVDATLALAAAGLLIAAAITVPSNANAPLIRGPVDRKDETEVDGTRVIQIERHFHHIHRPIEAFVPLLLLGGGLGLIGTLLGRDALEASRSRATTPSTGGASPPRRNV